MNTRAARAAATGQTVEIRCGMSVFQVRILDDGDGLYVARWTQRDEPRETGPCTSVAAAKMYARQMMREIAGQP